MDVAYDRIQEATNSEKSEVPPQTAEGQDGRPRAQSSDLGTEFKEAYQAFSSSVWGARIGGFFGQVKKQGESYYEGARQELSSAGAGASKGWTDLLNNTRTFSIGQSGATVSGDPANPTISADEASAPRSSTEPSAEVPESLPADIIKEAETILSRFRVDAAARLKQIQKAEDAADAALERFGSNIKNFLRDAVTIQPPLDDGTVKSEVLFESKDAEGKRVVHATRFDAQLHVIHSNQSSFNKDPDSEEFKGWKESFDVEKKTDAIAKHLDKFDELRRAMDKLVPEQVSYADFWARYYFLRHVIETEEQKRRELLKGTQMEEEEVAWDDDDDEDAEHQAGTPRVEDSTPTLAPSGTSAPANAASGKQTAAVAGDLLKPNEPRRSNEQSVADSDASYDIVSGATSRSPGTPKEEKDVPVKNLSKAAEESDEEDWE